MPISLLIDIGVKIPMNCSPWKMMLDVCHRACNAACSSVLMYSTGICASAGQNLPEGEDLLSQTTTAEGDRKDKATKIACSVEESRPGRELLTPLCINHSWYFLPSSREMRQHDTEDASTCNCKHVSSGLVGSDSM